MNRITPANITKLKKKEIFVFGSNAEGNHAGGAAKLAVDKFGAYKGQGRGLQGNSYAIDTMSGLEVIPEQIAAFILAAKDLPERVFFVTEIGCGIAGFTPEQIAPMFKEAMAIENIYLPESFWKILNKVQPIPGYKGFDKDFKCRDKQYEVGKEFTEDDAIPCEQGIHYCEYPLDVFSYYPPASSRFAQVTGYDKCEKHHSDSKVATTRLKVHAEINFKMIVEGAVKFIFERVDWTNKKEANTGDNSAATNTGYKSAATNTGNYSAATNTGNYSAASVEGKESVAINTGIEGKAKGKKGCWLVLSEWKQDEKYDWQRADMKTVLVDGDKIKEDVFYILKNGEFVEVQ